MSINVPSKYKLSLCLVGNRNYLSDVSDYLIKNSDGLLRVSVLADYHAFENFVFSKKCDILIIDDFFFSSLGEYLQQFQMLYDVNLFSIIMILDHESPLDCAINPHIFYRNIEVSKKRFLHNSLLYIRQADYFTRIARENEKYKLDAQNRKVAEKIKKKKEEEQDIQQINDENSLDRYFMKIRNQIKNSQLLEIMDSLENITETEELKKILYHNLKNLLSVERYSIFLVDKDFKDLNFFMSSDDKIVKVHDLSLVDLFDKSIMFEALYKKEAVYVDDFTSSRYNTNSKKEHGYKRDDCLCIPLMYKQSAIGVLNINDSLEEKITEKQATLAEIFSSLLAIVIKKIRKEF